MWLGERGVVGSCGYSVVMVAVGWQLVGFLMVCPPGMMGENYIWVVVWDRKRRDLEGAGWAWLVNNVLSKLELRLVAVGWQVWVSLVVSVVQFEVELSGGRGVAVVGVVVGGWHAVQFGAHRGRRGVTCVGFIVGV